MTPVTWALVAILALVVPGVTLAVTHPSRAAAALDTPCVGVSAYDGRYCRAEIAGWTVWVSTQLREINPTDARNALALAKAKLDEFSALLPPRRVAELRRVPLWIDDRVPSLAVRVYHPAGTRWPREHGFPEAMRGGVHITNAVRFVQLDRRQPYSLLHEFAHAYHDQVLDRGNPQVLAAYRNALQQKLYLAVKGSQGAPRKAYAMKNEREYFAELTETYFGKNNTYPFSRGELETYDPAGFAMIRQMWEDHPGLREVPVVLEGLNAEPCKPSAAPLAGRDAGDALLVVRNDTAAPLRLVWNETGRRKSYGELAPGALFSRLAPVTGLWLLLDQSDRCRGSFIAGAAGTRVDVSASAR